MNHSCRFLEARNFAVYYGRGCSRELACFDIAIVEPRAWDTQSLASLKSHNTMVLAYFSLLEPAPGEDITQLRARDLLQVDGRICREPTTGNLILDPRSRAARERLARLLPPILEQPYDGLFIDTAGDIERPPLFGEDDLFVATALMIRNIRQRWPGIVICQNWGLEKLRYFSVDYVDAFCWENYNRSLRNTWFNQTMHWLANLEGKRTLLLGETLSPNCEPSDPDIEMAIRCQDDHFISYLAPRGYVSGVNVHWLEILRRYAPRREVR